MTQQEILDYNKRCLEFIKGFKYIPAYPNADYIKKPVLKYTYKVDTDGFEKPMLKETNKKINAFMFNGVCLSFMVDLTKLNFHSDWNWIMEVYLKIRTIKFKLPEQEYGSYKVSKIIDGFSLYFKDKSTQEAVIQAINQFLIWYEQNK